MELDHVPVVLILQGIAVSVIAYWGAVLFYNAIPVLFPAYAARYKLQTDAKPLSTSTTVRMMLLVLFNQTVIPFSGLAGIGVVFFMLGGRASLEFPAWYMVLYHLALYVIIFEIGFFTSHRVLHLKPFYGWFHALHHRFRAPVPYCAACVHPVEFTFSYFLPNSLLLLFGLSIPEYILFVSLEYMHAVHDHCGYDYPWDPCGIVFGQNSRVHDEHHRLYTVNFSGAFTMLLDRLFKTYQAPPTTS